MQVKLMDEHPEYAWCGARTGNRTLCMPPKKFYTLEETLRRYIVHTSTVVFRQEHLSRYPRFPDVVGWISMVYAYLATKGTCGFLDEELSYYRHHAGGVWTGAGVKERTRLTRLFTDTMNKYFAGAYHKELADRELWIHRLQVAALISDWSFTHWRGLLGTMPTEIRRCVSAQPWQTIRTMVAIITAPAVAAVRQARRKLALRTRLRRALGNSSH
jgi:hypothetical protein